MRSDRLLLSGEVAGRFSIGKDTLIYYDRIGLFSPSLRADNGYRYYKESDLEKLDMILSLRALEMPIEEIKNYFTSDNMISSCRKLCLKEIAGLEERIRNLEIQKRNYERMLENLEEVSSHEMGRVYLEEKQETFFQVSPCYEGKESDNYEIWNSLYYPFLDTVADLKMPYVGALCRKKSDRYEIYRLFLECREGSYCRPSGLYAVYYFKGSYDGLDEAYRDMVAGCRKKGLEIAAEAYEEYLVTCLQEKSEDNYVTRISMQVIGRL